MKAKALQYEKRSGLNMREGNVSDEEATDIESDATGCNMDLEYA